MILAQALTLLGFATGGLVFFLEARRRNLATEGIGKLTLVALIAGLVGAKLTELVFGDGALFREPWALLDPRTGGRTIVGGILAGWLAVEIAKRKMGIKRTTGDMFALALPAGEAVGRLGCYVGGCCYGAESSVAWAVFQHGAFRHPTQLYLSAAALGTFLLLFRLRDRLAEGMLFPLYLCLFGAYRLVIEFFRVRDVAFAGLSVTQWVSIEIFATSLILLMVRAHRMKMQEKLNHG